MRKVGKFLMGSSIGLFTATIFLAVTPSAALAAGSGCPSGWDRFWADHEHCTIHGSEGDTETCCYWEGDDFLGCCTNYAT